MLLDSDLSDIDDDKNHLKNCESRPFSGSMYSKKLFKNIINKLKVKNFVETGTYKGITTYYLANKFPDLNIYTIEINEIFYNNLNDFKKSEISDKYTNVKRYLGNSLDILKNIISNIDDFVYYENNIPYSIS